MATNAASGKVFVKCSDRLLNGGKPFSMRFDDVKEPGIGSVSQYQVLLYLGKAVILIQIQCVGQSLGVLPVVGGEEQGFSSGVL